MELRIDGFWGPGPSCGKYREDTVLTMQFPVVVSCHGLGFGMNSIGNIYEYGHLSVFDSDSDRF
jgi:hypothetical protein